MCDFQGTATFNQTAAESTYASKQVQSPKRFEILCAKELMNKLPLLKPFSTARCANIEFLTADTAFIIPVLHFESREAILDIEMVTRKI